jgi:hypothetical protein
VEEYLKPGIGGCSQPYVEVFLTQRKDKGVSENDDPYLVRPKTSSDVGVAIGKHRIDCHFRATGDILSNRASVSARYQVIDKHDFNPELGLEINQWGVGYVPHRWIHYLKDKNMAAPFDIIVIWTEWSYVTW